MPRIAISYLDIENNKTVRRSAIAFATDEEYAKMKEANIDSPLLPRYFLECYLAEQKGFDLKGMNIPSAWLLNKGITFNYRYEDDEFLTPKVVCIILDFVELSYGGFIDAYAAHLKLLS